MFESLGLLLLELDIILCSMAGCCLAFFCIYKVWQKRKKKKEEEESGRKESSVKEQD